MPIRTGSRIPYSQVTPRRVYLSRRRLLRAGVAGLFATRKEGLAGTKLSGLARSPFSANEKPTPFGDVTTYNNFYEFGADKSQPARLAQNLKIEPWSVKVEGAAGQPRVFDLDAILKLAPLEERIYRHRCVEGWSMVVPWIGISLAELLKRVEPQSKAKYVAFESFFDSRQMPAAEYAGIPFPYVEGLRMDEAMHPLTLLTVGMYGETLPKQDGAPVRIVAPWKYGFKSIKSIVRIKLLDKQPPTTWSLANAREYGFYSNVNPQVDHPRWSQAKERRLGEFLKRDTLMFNGYGDQVAGIYAGMDLRKYY
jgi:sulfoxide reductase catalytic subunit YedY